MHLHWNLIVMLSQDTNCKDFLTRGNLTPSDFTHMI